MTPRNSNLDLRISVKNAAEAAQAIREFGRAADEELRRVDQANQRVATNARSLREVGDSFDRLEGQAKRAGRVLNDVAGATQLLGAIAPGAARAFDALIASVRGVSDVFGTLSNLLARNPLAVAITVIGLAATAFLSLRDATAAATEAQSQLAAAQQFATGIIDAQTAAIRKQVEAAQALAAINQEIARRVTGAGGTIARPDDLRGFGGYNSPTVGPSPGRPATQEQIDKEAREFGALVSQRITLRGQTFEGQQLIAQSEEAAVRSRANTQAFIDDLNRVNDQRARAAKAELERIDEIFQAEKKSTEQLIEVYGRKEEENKRHAQEVDRELEKIAERRLREAEKLAASEERAAEERQRRAEREAEQLARTIERATDRATGRAADILFDAFSGRITSIGELLKTTLLRAMAEVTAQGVIRPIIQPLIAGATQGFAGGGASTSGGSLLGGIGSLFNSPLSTLASAGSNLISGGGILSSIGSSIGGFLGIGGPSVASASASAAALGIEASGSLGAATLGSLSPLAATGIGAAVALAGGLILSQVLKGKSSVGPNASGSIVLRGGRFDLGGSGADNGGDLASALNFTNQAKASIEALVRSIGGTLSGSTSFNFGSFKGQLFASRDAGAEQPIYSGGDSGAAIAAAIVSLARSGNLTAPGTVGRVLGRSGGTLEQLTQDVAFARVYDTLGSPDGGAALQAAEAIRQVVDEFETMRATAERLGLALDRINAAQDKALEQATRQVLAGRFGSIDSLIAGLSYGAGSPLSAEQQLFAARTAFNDVAGRAAQGDSQALASYGSIAGAYLTTARGFFATSESYGRIYDDVLGRTSAILTGARDNDPVIRAIIEANASSTSAVVDAMGQMIERLDRLIAETRRGNEPPQRTYA